MVLPGLMIDAGFSIVADASVVTRLGDFVLLGGSFVLFVQFSSLVLPTGSFEFKELKNSSYSGVCNFFKSRAW